MLNLEDPNISYLLFSPESLENSDLENKSVCEKACSILYSKDYTLLSLKGLYNGNYEQSYLAIKQSNNNDELRKDMIHLLDTFHQDCGIVKYIYESKPTKIFSNGSEKKLNITVYNQDTENKTYLYNGVSFSFIEEKMYYFPSKKDELKKGTILEYFNNTNWIKKEILDVNQEFEDLYKLLMKYQKVRIPMD